MGMIGASEIGARCAVIRLGRGGLARLAALHPNTVSHILAGGSVLSGSLEAATRALEAEEVRLRNYLLDLHPLEAAKEAAE